MMQSAKNGCGLDLTPFRHILKALSSVSGHEAVRVDQAPRLYVGEPDYQNLKALERSRAVDNEAAEAGGSDILGEARR